MYRSLPILEQAPMEAQKVRMEWWGMMQSIVVLVALEWLLRIGSSYCQVGLDRLDLVVDSLADHGLVDQLPDPSLIVSSRLVSCLFFSSCVSLLTK